MATNEPNTPGQNDMTPLIFLLVTLILFLTASIKSFSLHADGSSVAAEWFFVFLSIIGIVRCSFLLGVEIGIRHEIKYPDGGRNKKPNRMEKVIKREKGDFS